MGGLDCCHDLGRVQQTEVHRRRQHRVGELPLCGEHRVLVRPEHGQTVLDELVQTDECLRSCDGPRPIGVGAERGGRQAIENVAVDVVELEPLDRRPGAAIARGRFAVVMIEVPLSADGLGAAGADVHQHAESEPLPPIEVLHREPLAPCRPAREVVVVTQEQVVAHQLDAEPLEFDACIPTGRFHREHASGAELVDVISQTLSERARPAVVDLESFDSQFRGEVRHRRQHEVQPLSMPAPRGDQRLTLDEQHAAVSRHPAGEGTAGAVQLIGEHPHGGNRRRHEWTTYWGPIEGFRGR